MEVRLFTFETRFMKFIDDSMEASSFAFEGDSISMSRVCIVMGLNKFKFNTYKANS